MSDRFEPADLSPVISVVVPLFNEEGNVAELYGRLEVALKSLDVLYEIVLVDDGSQDETPAIVDALQERDDSVACVHLSRNFGHQAAVSAGIDHGRGQAIVVMDGDLQDPPELVPEFVAKWREGFDVVYAVRRHRKEGLLMRAAYHSFYRLLYAISDLDIPIDSGDFCLLDRQVVDVLKHLPERMRFVRGLRSFVGFRQVGLPYDRAARASGRSKYSLRALIGLALDGLVSFSSYPLRLVTRLAFVTIFAAFLLFVWALNDAFKHHTAPQGWASTMVVVLVMGAVQLFSIGILGEYLRLIFLEVKQRPTYIIRDYRPSADQRGCSSDGEKRRRRPSSATFRRAQHTSAARGQ
jgi:dolichol-phosphate mannosyltransferase